jgi:hypothetical protein
MYALVEAAMGPKCWPVIGWLRITQDTGKWQIPRTTESELLRRRHRASFEWAHYLASQSCVGITVAVERALEAWRSLVGFRCLLWCWVCGPWQVTQPLWSQFCHLHCDGIELISLKYYLRALIYKQIKIGHLWWKQWLNIFLFPKMVLKGCQRILGISGTQFEWSLRFFFCPRSLWIVAIVGEVVGCVSVSDSVSLFLFFFYLLPFSLALLLSLNLVLSVSLCYPLFFFKLGYICCAGCHPLFLSLSVFLSLYLFFPCSCSLSPRTMTAQGIYLSQVSGESW